MGSFQERACGSAILFGLIVGSILLALSFYIVEPNYVGVDYNHVTESIDEVKLYTSGRHFLGIGHEMVLFSTTQQTRDLGVLTGRSKDGLSVQFEGERVVVINVVTVYVTNFAYTPSSPSSSSSSPQLAISSCTTKIFRPLSGCTRITRKSTCLGSISSLPRVCGTHWPSLRLLRLSKSVTSSR